MSKSIRVNVGANIGEAEQKVDKLSNKMKDLKKGVKADVNVNTIETTISEEMQGVVDNMDKISKSYKKMIDEFTKGLKDINKDNDSEPKGTPKNEPPEKSVKSPEKDDSDKLGGFIGKAIGVALTGKTIASYFSKGMDIARESEKSAVNIYNRTGIYGSDFNKPRNDAHEVGVKYGFGGMDTMEIQDQLMSATGFIDKTSLDKDTESTMAMNRAYGLDIDPLANLQGTLARSGAYKSGEGKELNDLISKTINANGMVGREDEVVRSIQNLSDTLTTESLTVESSQLENLAGFHVALGSIHESLKGERGAGLINKVSEGLDTNDESLLRILGYGGDLGWGSNALVESKKRGQAGLGNEDTVNALRENLPKYGLTGDKGTLFIAEKFNATIEEAEAFLEALYSGGEVNWDNIKSEVAEKNKNYQDSGVATRDEFEANKENASAKIGENVNDIKSILDNIYNNMSVSGQVGIDTTTAVASGVALNKGTELLLDKSGILKGLGGIGKGGTDFLIDDVMSTGSKGLGSLVDDAIGFGGKALSTGGKVLGKVAPYIPAAIGGVQAIGDYSKGNYKEGSEHLGSGLGGTGGALAGAAIGSMILPGIGTAIGGLLGGFAGDKIGKSLGSGIHDMVTGQSNISYAAELDYDAPLGNTKETGKDKNTSRMSQNLDKQELLLKKEEMLFDKFLGEDTKINSNFNDIQGKLTDKESSIFSQVDDGVQDYIDERNEAVFGEYDGEIIGGDTQEKVWNALTSAGYSKEAVAGIMGSIEKESGFKSDINEYSGGGGYGLIQWTGGRRTEYENYAKSQGKPAGDLDTQIRYLIKEMKDGKHWGGNYPMSHDQFKKTKDITAAAKAFTWNYERPAPATANESGRISAANQYYDKYANKSSKKSNTVKKDTPLPSASLGIPSSYAIGTPYVSEDKAAFLHKEEAVLNKFEARDYREGKLGNNNFNQSSKIDLNINITSGGEVDPNLVNMIKNAVSQAISQMNLGNNVDLSRSFARKPN